VSDPDPSRGKTLPPVDERLVRLPVATVIRVLRQVEDGTFPTFDAAVAAALEALIATKTGTGILNRRLATAAPPVVTGSADNPVRVAVAPPFPRAGLPYAISETVQQVSINQSAWKLMAFTAPRFLPLKAGLRFVVTAIARSGQASLPLDTIRDKVGVLALELGAWLAQLDEGADRGRGQRLATGFPAAGQDERKSLERFLDAYIGTTYRDGRATGVAPYLGYAGVTTDPSGHIMIGLTETGHRFTRLPNPVLDRGENRFPPFSPDEVSLLLGDIASRSRLEAEHMLQYLLLLRDRPQLSREAASASMRSFYERVWDPTQLTGALVDSMRMAVHGRCQELGLTISIHDGRHVAYQLTDAGHQSLNVLRDLLKVSPEVTG
jgi:hypothetical protein